MHRETMARVPAEYHRVWSSELSEEERERLLNLVDMDKALSYAWAIPDERALQVLAHYSPIVEMGGGTGYWARCLRERGVDVLCYDLHPSEGAWTEVLKGGPAKLRDHADRTLFLCYPDDFEHSDESMALQCL